MHLITILVLFLNLSLAYLEEEGKYVNVMKKYRREITVKQEKTDPQTTTISSKTEETKTEASKKNEKLVYKKRNEKWKKKRPEQK